MDVLRGVAHGKMIELESDLGLPDGQPLTVMVRPAVCLPDGPGALPPGEGLRRAFGAWAEDAEELDEYLRWNLQQRELSRPEIEP